MKNHITLIGCQKLKSESYFPKLTKIFTENDIKSITIVRMENPCCGNMEKVVLQAFSFYFEIAFFLKNIVVNLYLQCYTLK